MPECCCKHLKILFCDVFYSQPLKIVYVSFCFKNITSHLSALRCLSVFESLFVLQVLLVMQKVTFFARCTRTYILRPHGQRSMGWNCDFNLTFDLIRTFKIEKVRNNWSRFLGVFFYMKDWMIGGLPYSSSSSFLSKRRVTFFLS